MAEENVIQTNIVATSNMSGLISDLNRVSSALTKLQEQLNVSNKALANQISAMNRTFAETLRSTGQFSTHFVSLTSDVDKFGQQLDRGQLKLSQFFRVYGQHTKATGGLIRDLAKQQVQLQNAILQPLGRNAEGLMQYYVNIPRGLDEIKNKTALAKQELAIMNKVVQEGANQLINWGKNTQWAGRQLTVGLTVPMAAFGKAAADAFRTADEQLVRLTKVYGGLAQTSSAELQKVRKDVAQTASELSKGYGASFNETLGLAADIAATGKQGNELLGSIKETTRLAVLGEVDRQDAMKATLALQTAFKQNTEQLSESINFLNAVENQTSTTLADLIEAIPKAGPIIQGLGGSVKDLALYLTAMKEGGVNAAEGANALKSALGSLINPTKVATGMFAGFGIDLKGIVAKNAGNLTGTLLELQKALDTLNPLQKQQALEQLFGKFQFARMNALFSNLGKQGSQTLQVLDLMKASSQDLANIASRELSQVTESASGKYRRAVEGLKADLAGIGEQFLRINTVLINIVDGVIKFADKLPKPIKQLLSIMGMLTATAGPLIMLTGVLGNFFGYIIKGVYHFKSLFKGAEGWKLLTPEILAASKAGDIAEQTFYSDAKAAAILKQSLDGLIGSYTALEAKINSGVITVPAVNAMVGREVNPQHPLLSPKDTRSMSHLNPVSKMSSEAKMAQTMFGVVPGAPLVNQKIGGAPQIYMAGDLPKVQGLTNVGGVSTGVVAEEAAKWHAMTAALAMQSKAEIAKLKTEVANTGLITDELSTSYQALLPKMTELTQSAAAESAAIVAEMQASKITVDEARAKIVALNAQIEAMMGQAATQVAGDLGRNIDVTKVPLLNQPVVDPKSGKSNMKELLKPGRTRGLLNKIAGVLGVKTYGAPYSIETTRPRRFAEGGVSIGQPVQRYANGFVSIRQAKSAAKMLRAFAERSRMIGGLRTPNLRPGSSSGPSTINAAEAGVGKTFGQIYKRDKSIYTDPEYTAYGISPVQEGYVLSHALVPGFMQRTRGLEIAGSSPMIPASRLSEFGISTTSKAPHLLALPSQFMKTPQLFNDNLKTGTATAQMWQEAKSSDMVSLLLFLKDQGVPPHQARIIAGRAANVLNAKIAAYPGPINEQVFGKLFNNASVRAIASGWRPNMRQVRDPFGYDAHTRRRGWEPRPYADGVTQLAGYGGGDTVPALLEPGESVVTKTATRGNAGALTLMNAGVNLDHILGFKDGVVGARGKMLGTAAAMILPSFAPTIGGMLGSKVAGQTGQAIGQGVGTAVMLGSFLIPMLKQIKAVGAAQEGAAAKTGIFSRAMLGLRAAAMWLGPWGIAGAAAVTGLVVGLAKYKKHLDEVAKTNRLAFAGGIKPLESFDDKLKKIQQGIADVNAKNKDFINAHTGAGIPGIVMSVKQFQELQDKVKQTYPEIIKLFNQTPRNNLAEVVAGIKAQLIAAGDSAGQANAKIAALLSQTDKKGMQTSILLSDQVNKIKDLGTASTAMLNFLAKAQSRGGTKDFTESLLQTFTTLDESFNSISKKGGSLNAIKTQFDAIGTSQSKTLKLTQEQIDELSKTNPILASMLRTGQSIGDAYATWRIALAGVNKDLTGLNSDQLKGIAEYVTQVSDYFNKTADVSTKQAQSGPLASLAKTINTYNKNQTAMEKASANAAKNGMATVKEQIKLKEKQIKQIQDEANARKKALQEQQAAEDIKLQIQQEQLNYQDALAAGDMTTAAAAQLNIKRLVGQQQRSMAESAIDQNAQSKIDKLQAEIDALNAKGDAISGQTPYTAKKSPLEKIYADLNTLLSTIEKNRPGQATAEDQKLFDSLMKELWKVSPKEAAKINPAGTGLRHPKATIPASSADLNNLVGKTDSALTSQIAKNTGDSVSELTQIKNILNGRKDIGTGTGTKGDPFVVGNIKSKAKGRTGQIVATSTTDKNGDLTEVGKQEVIIANKLQAGTYFSYNGKTYQVKYGYDNKWKPREWESDAVVVKADGGLISGPGSGTSDSIPAMLSNGEYVINAASASKFGYGNLDKINGMAAGGLVRYNIPSMNRLKMVDGGGPVMSGDTISIGDMSFTFNQIPDNPRQFGNELMEGIKMGRGRLIKSA